MPFCCCCCCGSFLQLFSSCFRLHRLFSRLMNRFLLLPFDVVSTFFFFSTRSARREFKESSEWKKKLKPRHANFISPLYEFLGTKLFANEKSLRCREWRNFIVEGNSSKFLLNWNSSELLQKMFSAATDSLTKATRLRTRPETVRMKRLNYANLRQNDEAITAGNRETNIKLSARLCVNIIISIRAREQFCK